MSMEILKKDFDGIEYYLVDIYDDEFSFGTVYHFATDIGDKYCFYQDNTYIPIENKKYLKKIKEKLEINIDVIYKKLNMDLITAKMLILPLIKLSNIFEKIERLNVEEEYEVYDEVSKIINELYPDIPYQDTMEVLNDNSGIYFLDLTVQGSYNNISNKIYLNYYNEEDLEDIKLHESIHKLTNRNGYIINNTKLIGLIEGGTEKICEDKYGDKTSHNIYIGDTKVHVNFSKSTYTLQQVIYRQMAQLVDPQMADKSLINGNFDIFLNQFAKMYGKDLSLYLSHRAKMITLDKSKDLYEKKKMKYFKEAQRMLLTKVFDKKRANVKSEEDMINYMTELKNFEYCIGRIDGDNTFETYYRSKYNDIMELAKQKGIDLSKIEEFEYSPVEFYPIRNCKKSSLLKSTEGHLRVICNIYEELDVEKCTRIQIKGLPNFYNLDVVLQDGIPVSSVSYEYQCIIKEDKDSPIYEELGVDCNKSEIYDIADDGVSNAFMIINSDGTSEVYSRSDETSRIYKGTKNEIDLGITLEDIKNYTDNHFSTLTSDENDGNSNLSLLSKLKNFFTNLVHRKEITLELPDIIDNDSTSNVYKTRSSFLDELNPDNEIYDQSTIVTTEKTNENNVRSNER